MPRIYSFSVTYSRPTNDESSDNITKTRYFSTNKLCAPEKAPKPFPLCPDILQFKKKVIFSAFFWQANGKKKKKMTRSYFQNDMSKVPNPESVILCLGIQRSASTLIWNLVRESTSDKNVIKCHEPTCLLPKATVVLTVRDPRTAMLSAYRIWHYRTLNPQRLTAAIVSESQFIWDNMVTSARKVMDYYEARETRGGATIVLRYEDICPSASVDEDLTSTRLRQFLSNLGATTKAIQLALAHWSKEQARGYIASGNATLGLIHQAPFDGPHIAMNDATDSNWQEIVDVDVQGRIESEFASLMKAFDYSPLSGKARPSTE